MPGDGSRRVLGGPWRGCESVDEAQDLQRARDIGAADAAPRNCQDLSLGCGTDCHRREAGPGRSLEQPSRGTLTRWAAATWATNRPSSPALPNCEQVATPEPCQRGPLARNGG